MILCSESGVGKLFLIGPDSSNFRLVCHMVSVQLLNSTVTLWKQPQTLNIYVYGCSGCVPIKLYLRNRCLTPRLWLVNSNTSHLQSTLVPLLHEILMKRLRGGWNHPHFAGDDTRTEGVMWPFCVHSQCLDLGCELSSKLRAWATLRTPTCSLDPRQLV